MSDNRPINHRLISFAISAMLSSSFLSTSPEGIISAAAGPIVPSHAIVTALDRLQTSGWYRVAELTVPDPMNVPILAAAYDKTISPPPPITEAQLRKVINMLVRTGTEGSIKQKISAHLGLGKNGEKIRVRQLAIEDDNAVQYGFALLKDGSGYMLDKDPRIGSSIAFYLDENLNIVSAIAENSAHEITTLSPADAQAKLREVLATWAEYADQV